MLRALDLSVDVLAPIFVGDFFFFFFACLLRTAWVFYFGIGSEWDSIACVNCCWITIMAFDSYNIFSSWKLHSREPSRQGLRLSKVLSLQNKNYRAWLTHTEAVIIYFCQRLQHRWRPGCGWDILFFIIVSEKSSQLITPFDFILTQRVLGLQSLFLLVNDCVPSWPFPLLNKVQMLKHECEKAVKAKF